MATFNKAKALRRTLQSIFRQHPPFAFEVIVVDDGSRDETRSVCGDFPVRYAYLDNPEWGNSGPARNTGYRMAAADIIIAQSDEVEHRTHDAIARLVHHLTPTSCVLATVLNVTQQGQMLKVYSSVKCHRPLFFLGALWKRDIYAIGGNDEEFVPYFACEDKWFARCLEHLGRTFIWCDDVVGWHYEHPHHWENKKREADANRLYFRKKHAAQRGRHPWTARTGAWT